MREVLFRAKRKATNEWVYGYFVKGKDDFRVYVQPKIITSESEYEYVYEDTLGQFTGLTDKNGVKIFEGDIVRHYCKLPVPGGEIGTDRGTIKWDSEECFFFRTSLDNKDKIISAKCVYEVIGNIYDNPELIGGEEK